MSVVKSGNVTHDSACILAEMTRQTAVAAAGNNQPSARGGDHVLSRGARLVSRQQFIERY